MKYVHTYCMYVSYCPLQAVSLTVISRVSKENMYVYRDMLYNILGRLVTVSGESSSSLGRIEPVLLPSIHSIIL